MGPNRHTASAGIGRASRTSGFTLIELLVVIAIIAILAAILFPVFAQARAKARQTACLSNERQMSAALMQYVQDFDESFLKGKTPGPIPAQYGFGSRSAAVVLGPGANFPEFLAPYLKSVAVFDCPDSPVGTEQMTGPDWVNQGNYGYNYSGLTGDDGTPAKAMSDLDQPASVITFFETVAPTMIGGTNNYTGMLQVLGLNLNCGTNPVSTYTKQCGLRHQGRMNIVYADGHVKSAGWQDVLVRKGNNVPPWMITWKDCTAAGCPQVVTGGGQCFDPSKLP